ncbi:MAG: hypothetical protein P8Y37_14000, partial [Anaerolineales bacterium]
MRTKRAILLTLSILLTFALAACGAADSAPAPAEVGAPAADTAADTTPPTEEISSGAVISEASG